MKRALRSLASSLALAAYAACAFGPTVERFPLAQGPQGAQVTLRTGGQQLEGELVEARGEGLLVLGVPGPGAERRLVLVRYGSLREARFAAAGYRRLHGEQPGDRELARLRLASRFPQGLGPDLLQQLLHALAQQQVQELQ